MKIERFSESRSSKDKEELVEMLKLALVETIDFYRLIGRRFIVSNVTEYSSIIMNNSFLSVKDISSYDACILYTKPKYREFGFKGNDLDLDEVVSYGRKCLEINMDILDATKRLGLKTLVVGNNLTIILLR